MANSDDFKDESPFPSGPEMDLDMWRASGHPNADGSRNIEAPGDWVVCKVFASTNHADRDTFARRIEMLGDLYEGLRRAAEKMSEAGMDISNESEILSEFVTPKPFPGA